MYERFFGLVDAPFRLTPDPRYLFLSRKHADALAHLRLGLSESSGFVCITGDVGAGKTTILRSFLANLLPEITTAYVFNPTLSALELLQTINSEFGLRADTDSKKDLVDALNKHLLAQRIAGRRSVVVIDEAQALSVDVLEQLRLLSNLETTTEKLLRIVLVGQPQLQALLLHPELVQLNQRITLRWHLGPLSRGETAGYVRHRLAVASQGQAPPIFTPPALWLVHRYSRGVPRLINMIAHRAMLVAFADDSRIVTVRHALRAYREIETVPLPGAVAPSRRAAWAAAGVAVSLGVIAVGAGRFAGRDLTARVAPADAKPAAEASLADAGTPAAPPPVASPDAAAEPEAPAAKPEAAAPPPAAAGDAPAAAPAPAEAPVVTAAAEVPSAAAPPPAAATPAADVAKRLAAKDAVSSARDAVDGLLAAWRTTPLGANEPVTLGQLGAVASRRGLEYLPLFGNASMLRLLDLPAILELRVPDADGMRYAVLTGLDDERAVLVVDGASIPVERVFLEGHWFGQAHVLWRDFESLGPRSLGPASRGPGVARLQALLRRAGAYAGPASGDFDAETTAAVQAFQRSRLLLVDARVGKLTRIVLYAAAGGYARPTLALGAGAAS
ncbi:MAG TPA: AAA family ATPase [Candidatus Binatia bacterium]|nr:AAA family ATPase [Candidatus Binatia bacterium]